MTLSLTIRTSLLVFFTGLILFYFREKSEWLWFAVGGGLALVNVLFAAAVVRLGLKSVKNKAIFLGLLVIKSSTFVLLIGLVLVFLKPKLLAFTLGITVVIFGAIGAALYEVRHYRRQSEMA
jgi:hypothetical protein